MSESPHGPSSPSSPREIRCSPAELRRLFESAGTDPTGAALLSRKATCLVIRVDQLKAPAANILKQEMIAIGGDCATHREVILGGPPRSTVHLIATDRQLRRLKERLVPQPFGLRKLGEAVATLLAARRSPAKSLTHSGGRLSFGDEPLLMGIVNVTPDSFSDGGRFARPEDAVAAGIELVREGAALLDVGGESTRPGSLPVATADELARVLPVIRGLADSAGVPISVDTRSAAVAEQALAAGAVMVNDISALGDPAMAAVVAGHGAGLVLMHMRGEPRTMQEQPGYADPVDEIYRWLEVRLEAALATGIEAERIALDPGIGFGKRLGDNCALIRRLGEFHSLGRPLVLGASRKSFLGTLLREDDPGKRLEGSLAAAAQASAAGAQILRVHDVAATRRFLAAYLPLTRVERQPDAAVESNEGGSA